MLNDPKRPIDLFAQDHTHQLMRECHFGKAECQIRPFADTVVQSQGSSDDKTDMAFSADTAVLDPRSKFFGRIIFAGDLQCHDQSILGQLCKNAGSLFLTDLIFQDGACSIRCHLIRHFDNVQLRVTTQPFAVFVNGIPEKFFLDLPYTYDGYFDHSSYAPSVSGKICS